MLLNPNHLQRQYPDRRSAEIMAATVDFFESRGKARLKSDDHERVWYSEFLDHIGRERIFASLLTPSAYGAPDCRWDTYRISAFAEIVGFYGLNYWYPFQVTALGLGPIWMSANSDAKRKAAGLLEAGEVFAFGLSEQTHGADVYQTDMNLTPSGGAGSPMGRSTTSATPTWPGWSPPSASSPAPRRTTPSTCSSPPTPSTSAIS
ncbi:putative acyl-CoA dehydrogenase [Mycobacterium intracellulare]|nr:putative acyl-CoA dehydrogenase [Mycobacterium intracellulare]